MTIAALEGAARVGLYRLCGVAFYLLGLVRLPSLGFRALPSIPAFFFNLARTQGTQKPGRLQVTSIPFPKLDFSLLPP